MKRMQCETAMLRKTMPALILMGLLTACATPPLTGLGAVACDALDAEARLDARDALASGDPVQIAEADVKIAGWRGICAGTP